MSETALAAPRPATLWDLEENLQALLDTEALVSIEQQEEFRLALQKSIKETVDKRERVGQFLAHCDAMVDAADKEMLRLQERKALFAKARERMEAYLVWIIEQMPLDAKGKHSKLQARTLALGIQQNPASVEIQDLDQVPNEFRTVTVTVAAEAWAEHMQRYDDMRRMFSVDPEGETIARLVREAKISYNAQKAPVKQAIEAGADVPGADLVPGKMRLVMR